MAAALGGDQLKLPPLRTKPVKLASDVRRAAWTIDVNMLGLRQRGALRDGDFKSSFRKCAKLFPRAARRIVLHDGDNLRAGRPR